MKTNEINLLGHTVRDVVTGREGVAVSVSFDLSGCIQAYVQPKADKEGKLPEGFWCDTKRLNSVTKKPVGLRGGFEGIDGGTSLPAPASKSAPGV